MHRCIWVLPMAALFSLSAGAVERLPPETFSRQFVYDSATLSPDGSKLAVSFLRDDTTMLAVVDLAANKAVGVAGVKAPDTLGDLSWKSNDRLIYRAIRHDVDNPYVPVLSAVNADGSNNLLLNFNPQRNGLYTTDSLMDLGWEDPESVLIVSQTAKLDWPVAYRVNVMRGRGQLMHNAAAGVIDWPTARKQLFNPPGRECGYLADNAGIVRTCLTHETDNTNRLLYRANDGASWTELAHFGFGGGPGAAVPVAFTPDNRQFYVISTHNRNTGALFLYDPERKSMGELLFEAEGADLDDVVYGGDGRTPVAVTYYKKGMGIHYLDQSLAEVHQALNEAFKGQQVRLVSFSRDNGRIVVWAGDSSTPGTFYLSDSKKGSVQKIADLAPWIQRDKMAITRAVSFDARDGLAISGYLTLPRGAPDKNLPLMVQVHGGPHGVRDIASFDRDTQFFANRGYAVLQVNFRGSGGYGRDFRNAGKFEWGRKMQTDLEDGVKWLVSRGTVDPNRVGIFGGSYGGYAAMMALVTAPELFKCGISQAGVANLVRMLNAHSILGRSGISRDVDVRETLFWESVVGDRRDEAHLREISPVFNVEKVRAPVLLAHGGDDMIVPVIEATDLQSALKRAGKDVDLLVIPREGHGFAQEASRRQFYERMDAFLAKNLPTP